MGKNREVFRRVWISRWNGTKYDWMAQEYRVEGTEKVVARMVNGEWWRMDNIDQSFEVPRHLPPLPHPDHPDKEADFGNWYRDSKGNFHPFLNPN